MFYKSHHPKDDYDNVDYEKHQYNVWNQLNNTNKQAVFLWLIIIINWYNLLSIHYSKHIHCMYLYC